MTPPASPPSRHGLKRAIRLSFMALVVVLLVLALADQWHAMRDHIGDLSPGGIALTFVVLICALLTSMLSWRALLADMGSPLPMRIASRIFFVGQLAKYVPGSVWTVLASMELGRDHDVPRQHTGAATLLIYPLNVAVAVGVGAATLPFAAASGARDYAWALLVLPFCLALLHPRVLTPLLNWVARLFRRQPLTTPPTLRGMARAGFWAAVTIVLSGAHIYVLARDLGASGPHVLLLSLGAWATAWVVGFLLIIFPGGLGPREVALVTLMEPVLTTGAGAVLVVASRLIFAVAEVVVALAAAGLTWLAARRAHRAEPEPAPGPVES